jgi:hypothetical protein
MDYNNPRIHIIMKLTFTACACLLLCCNNGSRPAEQKAVGGKNAVPPAAAVPLPVNKNGPVIHVLVALCDNKYQGIVPVPARIGNGQDPVNNLYWGAAFGVKSFYKKQAGWQLVHTTADTARHILERCVFRNSAANVWLVADAYDGQFIRNCTVDFLVNCAGNRADSVVVNGQTAYCGGSARLLAYIGHDGLMDFSLTERFEAADEQKRDAIILACYSKSYFTKHLKPTGANPLLWSNGLMSPEAYTLAAAVNAWLAKQPAATVHEKAAAAYHLYQKCGLKAAKKLLATGW